MLIHYLLTHSLSLQETQRSGAVAEVIRSDTHPLQHGDEEVTDRSFFIVLDVTPGTDRSATAASHQKRQVFVIVTVPITDTTAVHDHCVIQQCAVPFRDGFHPIQNVGQLLNVEAVDFTDLGMFHRISLVVGEFVVPLFHVDKMIRTVTSGISQHESSNSCDISLESQNHHVSHQIGRAHV